LANATIAICNKVAMSGESLSQLPHLKLIAVAATGVDNVDLEFCRGKGINVCNTRGYAVGSLPEHALMLMLALRRNLVGYRDDVKDGQWHEASQFCLLGRPIGDLAGATIGIIGYGTLGQSMARLARAIGMDVLIAERKGATVAREGRTRFEDVLRRSDVISLHCPLTDETRNLIGVAELQLMKSDAILINTGGDCSTTRR
jgi:glycerate dehydrogenase